MIDLSEISKEVLMARGSYSTVRAAHENAKKELSVACSALQSAAGQILRKMQPGENETHESVDQLINVAKLALMEIERIALKVESLAKQRAELKKDAW
jgi:hypothetical protein